MPEFSISEPQTVKIAKAIPTLTKELVKQINFNFPDGELLGSGAESIVMVHPDNPAVVVGFVYNKGSHAMKPENLDASIIYNTHKIWSTLFPHNFPRIRAAVTGENARTVRTRVHQTEGQPVIYPLSDVSTECKNNGLPQPAFDLGSPHNKMVGKDGGEYYVDLLSTRKYIQRWDRDKLVEYMQKIGLPEKERKTVLVCEERLRTLDLIRKATKLKERNKWEGIGGEIDDNQLRTLAIENGFDSSPGSLANLRVSLNRVTKGLERLSEKAKQQVSTVPRQGNSQPKLVHTRKTAGEEGFPGL